ncbi:methyltransferase type 11 [Lentzea sp. NBRC 105346]|uniref:class I SAM-dependent methyltransferase n=1 Tax=Lentzea sp. NBRC 105346 TaxID=3032205 RepID=UPI0024A5F23C|nr:methyltransferase domain-containing protein [Lentzea sp. NBRC 105346]GLZ36368.1 methyltransferase type 11 [Lentzea sp. NBRC 105346]
MNLADVYSDLDAWQPAYLGSFLNWGYWEGIAPPYTASDRIAASAALYKLVASAVSLGPSDVALEVGSGTGVGACLLASGGASVHGIDVVESQVAHAREAGSGVTFSCAPASAIPYPDSHFSVVYSVEALQHFPSAGDFVREAARVLRPGGRFGVTTFFPAASASVDALGELLQSYRSGFDVVITVSDLCSALESSGFVDVSAVSIGEHVWRQLDDWIVANGYKDHWGRNFLRAYEAGLLDYHLVTAVRG